MVTSQVSAGLPSRDPRVALQFRCMACVACREVWWHSVKVFGSFI